ncbi:uncharacterized protein PRCAT00005194001 [Priceomyces carsonii]|uniref:uncharacterized protein n=1 Tax=Priceomyces carsonii TaxID=28549 RepID=UPI002ED90198|nr:unnamed protein product [Priceomyces carsonii]
MADYSNDPFQMDEDLAENKLSEVVSDVPRWSNIQNDITPRYSDMADSKMYNDADVIRSRLSQFKIGNRSDMDNDPEDNAEERTYEEDIDDKFDYDTQAKIDEESKDFNFYDKQPLTPPENFAPVINKIYRSSFPQPQNFPVLKRLKLKSILCLIPEEYPQQHLDFFKEQNIELFQLGMSGNKEPFVKISPQLVTEAIKIVLNPENQPILIHCNRGKHRTGCLVGVLRKLQKWSFTIIFDEYRKFAAPKERQMDQQFIELYDETELLDYCNERNLLPIPWD